MDSTTIGGLSKDSWECSGIAQPFCNPQDCKRLRQIWELTQNPAALCQDCKKMVQSTIPAEHSAKWLRIAVEFRNGPAIHTILCNAFNQPAILYRLAIPMQFELNVPGSAGDLAIVSGICGMVIDCVDNSGIASKSARVRTLDCKPIEIEVQLSGLSEGWWECSGIA